MSPTKILVAYLSPSFDESRNSISVIPIDGSQLNTGSAYLELGKLTNSSSVTYF